MRVHQQTSKRDNMKVKRGMLSNTISVDYDVSVLRMLRLSDTDNILIDRIDLIRKYYDMLLSRLVSDEQNGVRVHVRPYLLLDGTDRYLMHLRQGAEVVMWQVDQSSIPVTSKNLTIVLTDRTNTVMREGFLAIKTPTSNRVLAVWQDVNNEPRGVLITNPRAAEEIVNRLDAIVQSPAR
jgi:hypothetical protein